MPEISKREPTELIVNHEHGVLKYLWVGSRNLQNNVKLKAIVELTDDFVLMKGEDVDTERCTKYNRHLPKVLTSIFVKWQSIAFG
ncbi:hypothetical protein pdam_00018291 [Pocillopora damicornis]|uniref:Uncharacterized protein n=1 Tax=Pocillopora damicornis TaxID=46731 RepID=A0A3M6V763_POCDA|nr:hypothetical protein pdam_00018291 [Pocillopora damicornis]